jgi:Tol biopolymer transport system component
MRSNYFRPSVEFIPRETDPRSGSRVIQLTSGPKIGANLYCEVRYMDADSRYVMYTRGETPQGPWELWRADLKRQWSEPVASHVEERRGVAVSPDQHSFCISLDRPDLPVTVLRVEIASLVRERIVLKDAPRIRSLGTLAPDGRTYIYGCRLEPQVFGIVKADLDDGTWEIIHSDTEIPNAHVQIEPGEGNLCLIQHNRGCVVDERGHMTRNVDERGATLYVIDMEGNPTRLPIGLPHTPRCQGHEAWMGESGEVLFTVWHDDRRDALQYGNLLAVRPGADEARVVAGGHVFVHPNASKDGRFFVADTRAEGHPIVVGSTRTGRSRVLCTSGASMGRPQYAHPHPYFSPDCRWVIFNSDRDGTPRPHAASVPEGLLEELEARGRA